MCCPPPLPRVSTCHPGGTVNVARSRVRTSPVPLMRRSVSSLATRTLGRMSARAIAGFVPPMLLLKAEALPDDPGRWLYELKLDGYRAIAFKAGGRLHLRSRNDNDFSQRYPAVVRGLEQLPADTVVDGEVVAFDPEGRPSFNLLQNYASEETPIAYFVFDLLMLGGRDLRQEPLSARLKLLETKVLPHLQAPARYMPPLEGSLETLVHSVKA